MIAEPPVTHTTACGAERRVPSMMTPVASTVPATPLKPFVPVAPKSLEKAGVSETECRGLILKCLLHNGTVSGRGTADQIRLPVALVTEVLRKMKTELLVAYRASVGVNDYDYELTAAGMERAQRLCEHSSYFGAAPVPLAEYAAGVAAQSPALQRPTPASLQAALADLTLAPHIISQLGLGVRAGKAIFLYGAPGNGKTSIAERICRVFGPTIWIPRALNFDGEIVRLYDPTVHQEVTVSDSGGEIDRRWICIMRPTIVAGGELTAENLELQRTAATGLLEAPLQLKSNGGTLVIDDFGRQRMSTMDLLNRWIIPLERRVDYLNSPRGKKVQVPFEQLIVFSTNLAPKDLVDEAFLRRIPYKIEIGDPSETAFRALLESNAGALEVDYSTEGANYLIDRHFTAAGRRFRACHPRDLLQQIRNYCDYNGEAAALTPAAIDAAALNYFAGL